MNEPKECDWLRSTHLSVALGVPAFASFTLAGNEDSPARLDLYTRKAPEYNDRPVAVFAMNEDGQLTLQQDDKGKKQ